jgi:hypothetical protein
MDTNVISLRTREPVPEPMLVSTYSLLIGGEIYRVRRAVERDTKCGFVTIHDSCGKPVLVFSAAFPSEHIGQLIVAWRAGHGQGRERGRREGTPENVS